MSDIVARQYEEFPYPPRDPAEERKHLILGSPSHLAELDHYLFSGELARRGPLKILVAGGGTGDAAIMLAQQTRDAGIAADILYLDLSTASRKIAEERARIRELDHLRFATGSLLDPPEDGPFDYIDCCGVLHHLPDPQAGFNRLAGLLKPDGGMGIMVYAPFGRSGVYPMQAAIRNLAGPDAAPKDKLAIAKSLLKSLPPTNLFARNPLLRDHLAGDAALYDLLCHSTDRPYSVTELAETCAQAGLAIAHFIEPARYQPERYLTDPALKEAATARDPIARAALAEELAGNMRVHMIYAVKAGRPLPTAPAPEEMGNIPVLRDATLRMQAKGMRAGASLRLVFDGLPFDLVLPDLAGPILAAIDGKRDLAAIARLMPTGVDSARFQADWLRLYAALAPANKLLLKRG